MAASGERSMERHSRLEGEHDEYDGVYIRECSPDSEWELEP